MGLRLISHFRHAGLSGSIVIPAFAGMTSILLLCSYTRRPQKSPAFAGL